jgi:hypothetical protein
VIIPLVNDNARKQAIEAVQASKLGWVVSISKPNRTTAQNSLYWAVLHEVAEQIKPGSEYSAETWHCYFKTLFLNGRVIELPNGNIIEQEPTTTGMTTAAFSDYVERVIAWATERGLVWTDDLRAMRVERDTITRLPSIYQTDQP